MALYAYDAKLIDVQLNPLHPLFPAFRPLAQTQALELDREAFNHLDDALDAAYRGVLDISAAHQLHEEVVRTAAGFLPPPQPMDSRIQHVIELLRKDPSRPLEELSTAIGLSYHWLSHLFAEAVGLPLRTYGLWCKVHQIGLAFQHGKSLTTLAHEAGFSDSAHLSRTVRELCGMPLSYFLRNRSSAGLFG